jgi:hypothetical protein
MPLSNMAKNSNLALFNSLLTQVTEGRKGDGPAGKRMKMENEVRYLVQWRNLPSTGPNDNGDKVLPTPAQRGLLQRCGLASSNTMKIAFSDDWGLSNALKLAKRGRQNWQYHRHRGQPEVQPGQDICSSLSQDLKLSCNFCPCHFCQLPSSCATFSDVFFILYIFIEAFMYKTRKHCSPCIAFKKCTPYVTAHSTLILMFCF